MADFDTRDPASRDPGPHRESLGYAADFFEPEGVSGLCLTGVIEGTRIPYSELFHITDRVQREDVISLELNVNVPLSHLGYFAWHSVSKGRCHSRELEVGGELGEAFHGVNQHLWEIALELCSNTEKVEVIPSVEIRNVTHHAYRSAYLHFEFRFSLDDIAPARARISRTLSGVIEYVSLEGLKVVLDYLCPPQDPRETYLRDLPIPPNVEDPASFQDLLPAELRQDGFVLGRVPFLEIGPSKAIFRVPCRSSEASILSYYLNECPPTSDLPLTVSFCEGLPPEGTSARAMLDNLASELSFESQRQGLEASGSDVPAYSGDYWEIVVTYDQSKRFDALVGLQQYLRTCRTLLVHGELPAA